MKILWRMENYNFTNYGIILRINVQCQFTSTTNKLIIFFYVLILIYYLKPELYIYQLINYLFILGLVI